MKWNFYYIYYDVLICNDKLLITKSYSNEFDITTITRHSDSEWDCTISPKVVMP